MSRQKKGNRTEGREGGENIGHNSEQHQVELSMTHLELVLESCHAFSWNLFGQMVELCPEVVGCDLCLPTSATRGHKFP